MTMPRTAKRKPEPPAFIDGFGFVAENDWPLRTPFHFKLYGGPALDAWHAANRGKMPVFRTEMAARKMLTKLHRSLP